WGWSERLHRGVFRTRRLQISTARLAAVRAIHGAWDPVESPWTHRRNTVAEQAPLYALRGSRALRSTGCESPWTSSALRLRISLDTQAESLSATGKASAAFHDFDRGPGFAATYPNAQRGRARLARRRGRA